MSECEGYACPPGGAGPLPEYVTHLATTGGSVDVTGWVVAGLFIVAGLVLFAYNEMVKREK